MSGYDPDERIHPPAPSFLSRRPTAAELRRLQRLVAALPPPPELLFWPHSLAVDGPWTGPARPAAPVDAGPARPAAPVDDGPARPAAPVDDGPARPAAPVGISRARGAAPVGISPARPAGTNPRRR